MLTFVEIPFLDYYEMGVCSQKHEDSAKYCTEHDANIERKLLRRVVMIQIRSMAWWWTQRRTTQHLIFIHCR